MALILYDFVVSLGLFLPPEHLRVPVLKGKPETICVGLRWFVSGPSSSKVWLE